MTPDVRHARWVESLHRITQETYSLFHYRFLWRSLGEMTQAASLPPSVIFDALGIWYASTLATGVRRQVDTRKDTLSLRRLLEEIVRHPDVTDRDRHVRLWTTDDPMLANEAHQNYDRFSQGGSTLDKARVKSDIDLLVRSAKPVKKHVDEVIAHTAMSTERSTPTYADLNLAVDTIGDLVKKYTSFLEATAIYTLEPVIQRGKDALVVRPLDVELHLYGFLRHRLRLGREPGYATPLSTDCSTRAAR